MDRRGSRRTNSAGRVWWSRAGETHQIQGWVAEQSSKGIAFITPFARRLSPGEAITVRHPTCASEPSFREDRYSVHRVEPYDDRLSLVACVRSAAGRKS